MFRPGEIVTKNHRDVQHKGIILEVNYMKEPLLVRIQWMTPGAELDSIQNIYDIKKLAVKKTRNRRARKK